MSMPAPHSAVSPVAEFIARNETLRMLMEWLADRFADTPGIDDSIDWEYGEDHDPTHGPPAL
jgi:hypothetical protein